MKPVRITIENFMGLTGQHDLALGDLGLVHIAGRNLDDPGNNSNGSGKTTILEALTWGLFGEGIPRPQGNSERGVQADEVLNDRLDRQCRVTVEIRDGETTWVVERWRKWKPQGGRQSNGVRLTEGATVVGEALDEKETNRIICEKLGMTHDIWVRGVVFGQESQFNFCDATAKQRQEILTTVQGLEVVDAWHERCRDEKRAMTTKLAQANGGLDVRRATLAQAEKENPAPMAHEWELSKQRRYADAVRERDACGDAGKALAAELAAFQVPGEVAPAVWPDIPQELSRELDVAQRAAALARAATFQADAAVEVASKVLDDLWQLNRNAVCPTCRQPITAEHKVACEKAAGAQKMQAAALASAALQQLKAAERQLTEIERKVVGAKTKVLQERERLAVLQFERERAIRAHADLDGRVKAERQRWAHLDRHAAAVAAEVNPYLALMDQHVARLNTLRQELSVAEHEQAAIATALDVCLWWDRELPRFKTWMFDAIVDTLAGEANRWLGIMSGGVIWIQITTQKEVGDRLRDEVDVQIMRWNPDGTITSRPYRLWSGGEKRRVALAVDLGLSRLMASRAAKAYRFLALDEIDRHLDDRGKEGLRQVLEELRTEKDTCMVITHDPDFRASFDNELTVTKQGGQTKVEVNSGNQAAAPPAAAATA
jgi:DNA repair exonuclease SbcCD ATPase subunit